MVQGLCQRLPRECIVLMHFDSVFVLEEIWKERTFSKAQKGGGGGRSWVVVRNCWQSRKYDFYEERQQRKMPLFLILCQCSSFISQLTSEGPFMCIACWIS